MSKACEVLPRARCLSLLEVRTYHQLYPCRFSSDDCQPFYIKLVRRSQSSGRKEDVYVRICMDGTQVRSASYGCTELDEFLALSIQYDHFLLPRRESGVTCKAWQNGDGDVMPFMWCRRTDMGDSCFDWTWGISRTQAIQSIFLI